MNEMMIGVAVAALVGAGTLAFAKGLGFLDRRVVYRWLRDNTSDEPGESHVGSIEIAKGTALPEDRVRRACLSNQRIFRSSGELDQWSVWRKEPQSIYEKRGIRVIGRNRSLG